MTDDVIYEDILHEFTRMPLGRRKDLKPNILRIKRFRDNRRSFVQKHQLIMTGNMEHHWKVFRKMDFLSVGQPVICLKGWIIKLSIGGDDGYRLFVNDKHITGDWGNHSYSSREVELPVEAGKEYSFRIEFLIISLQQLSVLKHPG